MLDDSKRPLVQKVGSGKRALIADVQEFLKERQWEKYHNPKDLAESICIESAELLQLFQWIKPEETEQFRNDPLKVQLSMANTLNIDLTTAILEKIEHNKKKYPAEQYKGKAHFNL